MIEYGQGSTIGFYIEGDTIIDLDANDFKVLFYKKGMVEKQLLNKSDLTFVSTNKYYGEIPNTLTAIMTAGLYIQEVLFGSTYTSIEKVEAFTLFETDIKSEI